MTEFVQISGLKELRETLLRELPREWRKVPVQQALAAAASPVVSAARRNAPKLTGLLRKSITSVPSPHSTETYIRRDIGVKAKAFYWRFQEFGHRVGRGSTKVIPARPFLRTAWEDQKNIALERFRAVLEDKILRAAARAAERSFRARVRAIG